MSTMLRATGIRYEVNGATLVAGVDLEVAAGELVAIAGPNGAGKSTLVRMLAGDLRCDAGTVHYDGRALESVPVGELALLRAVLDQRNPPDIPFTVAAVVSMGRYPHRRRPGNSAAADAAAIEAALAQTYVAHLAGRTFATLSGGEQTRVNLARVLAQETPLLLLDEPTTALDIAHEELVMRVVRSLTAAGRCVVAVLHDMNTAAAYADRIVLMSGGAVRESGAPREVLRADVLSEVYGQSVQVVDHPFRDCPLVLAAD